MMRIDVEKRLTDAEADALAGTLLTAKAFDVLVREDAEVYKPDGTPLLFYRKDALPAESCKAAHAALRKAARKSHNRGLAAGNATAMAKQGGRLVSVSSKARVQPIRKNGTISRTDESAKLVESGVVGYYDRYERTPYCRLTAFNLEHPERFAAAIPFIRAVDAVFRDTLPDRYAAQRAVIGRTHPDFFVHGTVFTTITVNRNWQTAVHKDKGDYVPGFGVMGVLEGKGHYDGGYLVFPQYRVAVDMRTRGVCLADVHSWHGNTPLIGRPGNFERISCVFYYRVYMFRCGSAAEELQRAKSKKLGESRKRWD
jgi:hypothetical protein